MTTPANFSTAMRIIERGMFHAGKLAQGDLPNSEDFATHINTLNDIINLYNTDGLKLWTNVDTSVVVTAGTNLYTFGPSGTTVMVQKPLRVVDAYYLDVNGIRRPITPALSRRDYDLLSNPTQQGTINQYFVDKTIPNLSIYLWMTPDATAATGTVHLILQAALTKVVGLLDTLNFPEEWFLTLQWALADEICTGMPQAVMDRCMRKRMEYEEKLTGWDVEDADTRFTPDPQMSYYNSSFQG